MEKISREQIESIVDLQEIEIEVEKIETELKKLPEKLTEMEFGLREFESVINIQKEGLSVVKKAYRSFEADMQTHQSRIKKREEQLRSVKTNKEYQAILKEMDEIKEIISHIEDQTIECLDKIDAAEKDIQLKLDEYESEKENINTNKMTLERQADENNKKLQHLISQRDRLSSTIEPELLRQYQFVKSISGGIAIVEVKNAVCFGCNMNIPPQMYNELHRGNELKNCPHCHRMLYVI
jgi:uncharacterized protein